jgi:LysM repeat protein
MRWNHLSKPYVHRGQRLKLRVGDAALASASAQDSSEVAKLAKYKYAQPRTHRRRASINSGPITGPTMTVRAGDTLETIAKRSGVTVAQLKRANGLSTSRIYKGQRLKLREG